MKKRIPAKNAKVWRNYAKKISLAFMLLALAVLLASCRSVSVSAPDITESHEHEWTPWVVILKPSCTEEGEETRNCSCSKKESRKLPKAAHSYQLTITPPSDTEQGYTTYTCACGKSYRDNYTDRAHQDANHDKICDICGYLTLAPGLYDADNVMLASWDALVNVYGMKADVNYSSDTYQTETSSPYYLLTNTAALQNGSRLVIGDISKIGNRAFCDCTNLTSITVLNGVTGIGENAFENCKQLTGIILPSSLTSIGKEAFYRCTGLASITIPDSVSHIGNAAFYGCRELTIPIMGKGVTSIGSSAFGDCHSITDITIPAGVKLIEFQAFLNCTNLTNVTIQNGVTNIEKNAFCDCTSLTNLTIPPSVTHISNRAFGGCTNLTNIIFTGTVDEWNAISIQAAWNEKVPATKVICSNGVVDLVTQ